MPIARLQRELAATVATRRPTLHSMLAYRPQVRLFGAVAVVVLVLLAYAMVRVTGGSPNPLNHLAYPPILVAAFLFGWRGGVAAGILAGVVLGPLANVLASAGTVEALNAWSIRAAAFIGVGLVAGLLFDQGRAHADAWREAAITIAVRERDGIVALARGAEAKDGDTGDHIVRVQLITERLALATGASEADAAAMGWSAMLHDVGKLHIPDRILLKPGPLSADESTVMEQHPIYGEQILQHGAGFELARRIARWHHENLDGSGYPDGLSGAQIPLEARIVRVADAFDAMTHTRPYKDAADLEWALEELDRCAGTQFDPELVRLFVRLVRRDGCWIERLAEHRRSSAVQRPIGALRGV